MSCNTCTDCLASGSRPDLSELVQFRARTRSINIPQEVGGHYNDFGYILLKGHMRQMQHIIHMYQEKPEHVNLHILLHWLEGKGRKPVTWRTLVYSLKDIGLDVLAREIQDAKTTTGTADEPPPTPAPGMSITHVHEYIHILRILTCTYICYIYMVVHVCLCS